MKKKVLYMAATLIMVSPAPSLAAAPADTETVTLPEVVVAATRAEQQYQKVPATITILTAEQIRSSGAQTVPEVLESIPGISVLDLDGTGLFQKVDIGGFGDTADRHVAVVVNGRKVNPVDLSNVSWASLPVENIERIEILYGGGVLYGDNAMGGVVNIVTKQADKPGVSSNLDMHYGSFDTIGGSATIDVANKTTGVHVGIMHQETDGYRDHSANRRQSAFADTRLDVTDKTAILGMVQLKKDTYELPDALTALQMEQDRRQASPDSTGDGDSREGTITGGFEYYLSSASTLKADLTYQHRDNESRWQGTYFGIPWSSKTEFEDRSVVFTPQFILRKPLARLANRFIIGFDFFATEYESISSYGYTFTADRRTYSFYLQNELQLTDSLFLHLGGRYEKPEYEMDYVNPGNSISTLSELDDEEWAYTAGLSYVFTPDSKIYARMYRSFRYPRVDEFVSLFNGTFNSDLKQETALGFEIGVNWVQSENFALQLRTFLNDVSDEIFYNDATGLNENLDDSRRISGDLFISFRPVEMITLTGGVAYLQAEISQGQYEGNEVPLVPAWKGNIGLDIHLLQSMVIGVDYTLVDNRYMGNDFPNAQERLGGYQTLDITANYTIHDSFVFYASARNILNEKYENGYYDTYGGRKFYPMPEARYLAGVRVQF